MSTTVDPREIRSPIIASWVLMIATCILAVIPFLGFSAWIIGAVTVPIVMVLAIVAIAKGGTWSGIFVLLMAMIVVPVVIGFGPIISTLITAAILDEKSGEKVEMIEETADAAAEEIGTAEEAAMATPETALESAETAPGEAPPAESDSEGEDQSPPGN